MRVGITGHRRLKDPDGWGWVRAEVDSLLASLQTPLTGITSLAVGADQLFAHAVLKFGGSLEVVIPFAGYELTFSEGGERKEYLRLLQRASKKEVLEKSGSDEDSYLASGKRMVDLSELLIAVWDSMPAVGKGGTGDVVGYAAQQRKKIIHLNPITREVKRV